MSASFEERPYAAFEGGDDTGARLLKAVEAISISPHDAQELVHRHRERLMRTRYGIGSEELRAAVCAALVRRYSRLAATTGGATALAGVVPGVGTALAMAGGGLADVTLCVKLQSDMCLCLAAAYDWDLTSQDARHLSFLLAASGSLEKFGVPAGAKLATEAGVKMLRQYLRGAVLVAVKQAFKRLGLTFTRAALEKAVPFGVGVAVSSSANYALTTFVGRAATRWFELDAATPPDTALSPAGIEERETDGRDVA